MTKQIWKFPLTKDTGSHTPTYIPAGIVPLMLPAGAEILTVQAQGEVGTIWAMVDPQESEKEERKFEIIGTGQDIEPTTDTRKYIGTYQNLGGSFIWHVFERI
jgi:hypothetical protein